MLDPREAIAGRLERAADRMHNSGRLNDEKRLRDAASRVRSGIPLGQAKQIEQTFLLSTPKTPMTAFAAAGEYGGGEEDPPGTHQETVIVDGKAAQVQVPDGFHAVNQNGIITFAPNVAPPTPTPPAPTAPAPPAPTPPAPTAPAPTAPGHEPHEPPSPTPPTPAPGGGPVPIGPGLGQAVANRALLVATNYAQRGVKYVLGGDASAGGNTSDCSHFVHDVFTQAGIGSPLVTAQPGAACIANSPAFVLVSGSPQPGDIVVEQVPPSGSWHMGVYQGTHNSSGAPIGMQMGNHGTALMPWAAGPWGNPNFYRPKK
jgi:cell wall-associated NlpC family hydrolase